MNKDKGEALINVAVLKLYWSVSGNQIMNKFSYNSNAIGTCLSSVILSSVLSQ